MSQTVAALYFRYVGIGVTLTLASSCASPAGIRSTSPPALASSTYTTTLSGPWLVTLSRTDGTELVVRMTFEAEGETRWKGYSRSRAATKMLPWHKALAGRLLRKLPPHGALLNITGGISEPRGSEVMVRGTVASPLLGTYLLSGSLARGRLSGELRRDSMGAATGALNAVPLPADQPVRDYHALAAAIRHTLDENVYDPALMERREWREFLRALEVRFAHARDDLDALAAFYALKPRLGTSHLELFRNPSLASIPRDSLLRRSSGNPDALVNLTFPAPGVALLRVSRWDQVTPAVKRAFERIDSVGSRVLVLDVRGNPGGDVSSMAPASHLLRDSTFAGVFLGRKWYQQHRRVPTATERTTYPVLSKAGSTGSDVMTGVREHGVLSGVVPPQAPYFGGEVYMLVNRRSGSATEPLAHLLKATGRATLVGERTAGAMLSAPPHPLVDGWVLILPEADYYTAEGLRLEGAGVSPHIQTPSNQALTVVAERIRQRDPYAGALLLGNSHFEAQRWTDAEGAFRQALQLQPTSALAVYGLGRVYQARKQWDEAFDAFEQALRYPPHETDALYQIGRSAALSGQRLERGDQALRAYLERPQSAGQPSRAAAHWRLGMILEAQGRPELAAREYEIAVRMEPADVDFQNSLQRLKR